MKPEEMDYDLTTIKHSSRLITLIELQATKGTIDKIIEHSNKTLFNFSKRNLCRSEEGRQMAILLFF